MKKFMALLVMMAVLTAPVASLAGQTGVSITVDGLSCPFCAYGLEKKLKKMEGVENLVIDIENGRVEIILKDKSYYDQDELRRLVKDAGFTPRGIEVKDTGD
ncbi:MAG: heavy-metal-associated domain-containing protein [Thermodesulfobacteriota bacterium]